MAETRFEHRSVLLEESVSALALRPEGLYVDVTAGGGGHSAAILAELGVGGRLIALDRDLDAVSAARKRLAEVAAGAVAASFEVVHSPMSRLSEVLRARAIEPATVDGILADLGVSSHQLDTAGRGFSFAHDGPLDMRMDRSTGSTAADLVNNTDEMALADLIYRLGDEPKSRRIARAITQRRQQRPFARTADLAEVVSRALGGRRGARKHPATRTFQALRMALNDEAGELHHLLQSALEWLAPRGRLALISFHSGEDRVVKRHLASLASSCSCPSSLPVCVCGESARVRLLGRKGITASQAELEANPRARSARLRVAEVLAVEGEA